MMTKRFSKEEIYTLFYKTLERAVQVLPEDVKKALKDARTKESDIVAQNHIDAFLRNINLGEQRKTFVCGDTGWTSFYVKLGDEFGIEGGLSTLQSIADQVVADLSAAGKLRPTLADPVTRKNIDSNVGDHFPKVEILPDASVETLEVTAVPKGGGSEISGTFYRSLLQGDGMDGIIRFVMDCFISSSYSGKTCPPNVIGVGIGGTADVCMAMSKKAATLRIIGDRHPDPSMAKLEVDLLSALNDLGIGPMGSNGKVGVLDVHVGKALVHTGALPVAFTAQCAICRRATGSISSDGKIFFKDNPKWRE